MLEDLLSWFLLLSKCHQVLQVKPGRLQVCACSGGHACTAQLNAEPSFSAFLPSVTRRHIHTHRDNRCRLPTGPASWFHVEKPKIDMWTADYKSTRLKLNCAKSIAAQIPSWMPLILIINLLARSHEEAHIPATTDFKL